MMMMMMRIPERRRIKSCTDRDEGDAVDFAASSSRRDDDDDGDDETMMMMVIRIVFRHKEGIRCFSKQPG